MHKLLLALFIYIFVVLVFPNSTVSAQEACLVCPLEGLYNLDDKNCWGGKSTTRFPKVPGCPTGKQGSADFADPDCICIPLTGSPTGPIGTGPVTKTIGGIVVGPSTSGGGLECDITSGNTIKKGNGVRTAIGCIPTEPKTLVESILKFATLGAGGIAFILMILGALGLITAEGNPENIKKAQERFYSAIIGLLFIIFAVLLMQLIGVDILGLPGFGRAK